MGKVEFHLGAVPSDKEGQFELCLALYCKLTGKEPTPEDVAASRKELGLPPDCDGKGTALMSLNTALCV